MTKTTADPIIPDNEIEEFLDRLAHPERDRFKDVGVRPRFQGKRLQKKSPQCDNGPYGN